MPSHARAALLGLALIASALGGVDDRVRTEAVVEPLPAAAVSPSASLAPDLLAAPSTAGSTAAVADVLSTEAVPPPTAAPDVPIGRAASVAPSPSPVATQTAPRVAPVAPQTSTRPTTPPTSVTERPRSCPADWLCYPRVGLSGPIVAYSDCTGSTDIGSAIRAFTCLSPRYLLGHAYTSFGKIANWRAGDTVFAYGQQFTISGAITARSCERPPLPLAPLSLQTSLSADTCGLVLIVQAR